MNPQMNSEEVQVLDFVNESRIKKKLLKIRSFNLFHKCQYKCVSNIKSTDSQNCLKKCEIELDDYEAYKKTTGGPDFKNMFWAIPQDNPELLQKYGLSDEELQKYSKQCLETQVRWQDRLSKMETYLNTWEDKIKSR